MKAIQLEKPHQFRRIELATPKPPGPGQALVRVHRVGVCGTDYSGFLGKMPFFSYPRIPGHELGVEVVAVGEGVTHVQVEARCSVEPYMNCEACFSCRQGSSNCCENLKVLGVMMDGGLCEFLTVPARKLHVSQTLAWEQLALVETLAIGCHAVNRAQPRPGDNVLIVGAGPIGLAVLEFVKLTGARSIILDLLEPRLNFAKERMGAGEIIHASDDAAALARLKELTGGTLAQVVIDATGNNKSMGNALNYVSFTGRLVFVGITQQEVSFPHAPIMHRRELTLLASRNALPPDFTRIIQLIEKGQIDTRPWITHQAEFEQLIEAFPRWLRPEAGVIKAMVTV